MPETITINNIPVTIICSVDDVGSVCKDMADCAGQKDEGIRLAIQEALSKTQKQGDESIVFYHIDGAQLSIPVSGAAKIFVQEIMRHTRCFSSACLRRIDLCINDDQDFRVFKKTMEGYWRHIQEDLGPGPYVTVDIIIEVEEGIILIERSNPPYGWALPGGFLDYGESLEEAAAREAKEETNVDLIGLRQFHTYSKPGRDPRFQTVSTVFIAKGRGAPQFGDDAKGLKIVKYNDLLECGYAFDHKDIIRDYLQGKNS